MSGKIFYKRFLLLLVGGALALFVAYTGGAFSASGKRVYAAFSDGCIVSAVLLLGGYALCFCKNHGAFDGLTFALFSAFQKRAKRESYRDYRAKKENARARTGGGGALYAGTVYLVLSAIFLGFAV